MSGSLKIYRKAAVERRRLYIDYSCWLEPTEKLLDFQVSVSPYTEETPVVTATSFTDDTSQKLTMFVSGGAVGTQYTLSLVVRTDVGQVKQDNIGMMVTAS